MFDNSLIEDKLLVHYMEKGFRDWKFKGWARNLSKIEFGAKGIDNFDYCAVYVKYFSNEIESDDETNEAEDIKNGKNAVVLYYGTDNTSYMVRHKQRKIIDNKVILNLFDDKILETALFYNS